MPSIIGLEVQPALNRRHVSQSSRALRPLVRHTHTALAFVRLMYALRERDRGEMKWRMRAQVEAFLQEHQRILEALQQVEAAADAPLPPLQRARELVLTHFRAKDLFYPALAEHLTQNQDLAGAQLARIFEQNMKIQSAAVQRFFENLDRAAPAALADGFRTVALVIRQRFSTEEKAVFPLTVKKEPRGKR